MGVRDENCCNFNLQLKCVLSSSFSWLQARSLKFEDRGRGALGFSLSSSHAPSSLLPSYKLVFGPFRVWSLGRGIRGFIEFLVDWCCGSDLAGALWTLKIFEANFPLEGLSWVPQRPSLSPLLQHLHIQQQFISSFHPRRRPFRPGAKHNHVNSLSLRDLIWSIGDTIHPDRLWECSYLPTPQPSTFWFLQCDPVSRPVSLKL